VKGLKSKRIAIGLVSDTHGLLRDEAIDALGGSDLILHAGDVGSAEILERLRAIAPVFAVRGNNDKAPWAFELPETKRIEIAGARLFLLHDVKELAFEPAEQGIAAVISGHSHQPGVARQDGVLWVNPGSAGPRRFKLPVCVGRMIVDDGKVRAEIIPLDPPRKGARAPALR
jgi:putative phosphoesterase